MIKGKIYKLSSQRSSLIQSKLQFVLFWFLRKKDKGVKINIRAKVLKFLEEKKESFMHDIGFENYFLTWHQKHKATKDKNR